MNNIQNLLKIDIPIILASKSPRRKNLLQMLGLDFKIIVADVDESIDTSLLPEKYCTLLSENKAKKVAELIDYEALIISADTIVVLDGKIINKPESKSEAFEMLNSLSDNTHQVFTGITLLNSKSRKELTDYKLSYVSFRKLDSDEINAYIDSGSPFDKAGGYGIQDDFGAVFVKEIKGCFYNVVGLPLELLYSSIKKFQS